MAARSLTRLLADVRACRRCEQHLPLGPRPILIARPSARILIAGQAPSRRVHHSGIPWNDVSGQRLRRWLAMSEAEFYDPALVAIIPMGFCYPGTGRSGDLPHRQSGDLPHRQSGDLPPRPECRATWHDQLFAQLKNIHLRVVIGRYAQDYHLATRCGTNLTATVRAWRDFAPAIFPLPHPTPRNRRWLRDNPWFEREVLPELQSAVRQQLKMS